MAPWIAVTKVTVKMLYIRPVWCLYIFMILARLISDAMITGKTYTTAAPFVLIVEKESKFHHWIRVWRFIDFSTFSWLCYYVAFSAVSRNLLDCYTSSKTPSNFLMITGKGYPGLTSFQTFRCDSPQLVFLFLLQTILPWNLQVRLTSLSAGILITATNNTPYYLGTPNNH